MLAVVLLDELEKAHKVVERVSQGIDLNELFFVQDVTMILLQILDEGTITDSQGRKVDFRVRVSFQFLI
jgi:ATP-dependent Clp protease ATP-binding subunit ClpB